MKTLVVYYSRKGYAEKYAKNIAEKESADLLKIVPTERTKGFLGFMWCGRFGMHRWGMPIEKYDIDVAAYDKVILCSSVWVFTVAAPMREFVKQNAGKIKSAEYVLLHFSSPMKYKKTCAAIDNALGIKRESFTSVVCRLGHIVKEKII